MNMKIPYFMIILAIYLASEFSEAGRYNCKKPSFRNGRARIRSKGRLVRYRCKKRFKLYGAKVALCVTDKWNFPTPVCVAAGRKCSAVEEQNGLLISKQLNGGLLKFSCKFGLTLEGKNLLYCDGSKWSSKVPQCIYKESKKSCDFETADLCGWMQDDSDSSYFDWTRTTAAEMTHSQGTGPTSDHTFPDKETGHYLFMEASKPRQRGNFTRLLSPYYAPARDGLCLEFWYHMHGPDGEKNVGTLTIGIDDSGDNIVNPINMWNIAGNQGDFWHKGSLPIGKRISFFQIVITGTRGEDFRGDIAIDDLSINNCTDCTDNCTDDTTANESTAVTTTWMDVRTNTKSSLNSRTNQAEQPIDDTTEASSLGSSEEEKTVHVTSKPITDYRSPSHVTTTDMNGKITIHKTSEDLLTYTPLSRTISTKKRSTSHSETIARISSVTKEYHVETSKYSLLTSRIPERTAVPTNLTYVSSGATTAYSHSTQNSGQNKVTKSNKITKPILTTESHTILPKKKTTTNQSVVTDTTILHTEKQTSSSTTINQALSYMTSTIASTSLSSTTSATFTTSTSSNSITTPITTTSTYSNSTTRSTVSESTSSNSTMKQKTSIATSLSTFTMKSPIKTTNLSIAEITTMSPKHVLTEKTNKDKTTYAMVTPQTIRTSMSKTTIDYNAFSTSFSLTARQGFNSNNTINEVIITTHSTNSTDIPNVIVIGQQSASDDPPVRPLMIGLGVGVAIGLVIVIVGSYLWVRRRRRKEQECDEMMPITGTGSQEW